MPDDVRKEEERALNIARGWAEPDGRGDLHSGGRKEAVERAGALRDEMCKRLGAAELRERAEGLAEPARTRALDLIGQLAEARGPERARIMRELAELLEDAGDGEWRDPAQPRHATYKQRGE
jgi:hypothetical protein